MRFARSPSTASIRRPAVPTRTAGGFEFDGRDLARSLLEADLVDRLNLFLYPLTFGSGKRLFSDGAGVPAAFRLAQPPQAFPKGAVQLVYDRAGDPVTGIDISQP